MSHLSHQDTVRQGQQLYDNLESAFKIHVQKQKQLAEAQIKASRALFEHHRKQRDKLLNVLRIAVQDKSTSDIFLCKRSFSKLLEKRLDEREHALVVVAEGAGQHYFSNMKTMSRSLQLDLEQPQVKERIIIELLRQLSVQVSPV